MRALVLFAASIVATNATAAVIGYVNAQDGRIDLHDTQEQCVGQARHIEFVPRSGEPIRGCWLVAGGMVRAVFLDGDVVTMPVGFVLKPAKT